MHKTSYETPCVTFKLQSILVFRYSSSQTTRKRISRRNCYNRGVTEQLFNEQ